MKALYRQIPFIHPLKLSVTEGFYAIGNGKVSVQKSKTEDENMRVLSMAAIAEELKKGYDKPQYKRENYLLRFSELDKLFE